MITRRHLLLSCAACTTLALPLARADLRKVHQLGIFNSFDQCSAPGSFHEDLLAALKDGGYSPGQDPLVESRCAVMKPDDIPIAVAALGGMDVVYTFGAVNVKPLQRIGVPIIATVDDAVEQGLTREYRRPEGNVTGLCNRHPEAVTKLISYYRRVLPQAKHLAIVGEGPVGSPMRPWMFQYEKAARAAGLEVPVKMQPVEQFERAYSELQRAGVKGAFVWAQKWEQNERAFRVAARYGIATISVYPDLAVLGGLIGYNVWIRNGVQRLAAMIDLVFKGRRIAEIPWELPDEPLLSVNLGTAKALGLAIPQEMLLRATRVVQ